MNTITVGKKRNVTFIPVDQNGNPNPVDANGVPLQVVGIPSWSLGPLETKRVAPREGTDPGFTLVPAADGLSCDVVATTAGVSAAVHCYADRGDGVMVHGGAVIESTSEAGPVTVIAGLTLQFGEEVPAV